MDKNRMHKCLVELTIIIWIFLLFYDFYKFVSLDLANPSQDVLKLIKFKKSDVFLFIFSGLVSSSKQIEID